MADSFACMAANAPACSLVGVLEPGAPTSTGVGSACMGGASSPSSSSSLGTPTPNSFATSCSSCMICSSMSSWNCMGCLSSENSSCCSPFMFASWLNLVSTAVRFPFAR